MKQLWGLVLIAGFFMTVLEASPGKEICPYCKNSPELLKKAGLIGHGPFPYAATNSEDIEKHLSYVKDIYWLESEHFKFATTLPSYLLPERERKKIQAELEELKAILPTVNSKTRTLDPWLRIHLFVFRAEKFYQKFLDFLGLTDKDFHGTRNNKYMGEGRFLGEKGKYEIFLFQNRAPYLDFLKTYAGLDHDKPQRWNFLKTDSLWFGCHTQEEMLNQDLNLYATTIHNITHNLVDGYRHYSYDLPVWLTEGMSLYYERQVNDDYASYCFDESFQDYKHASESWPNEIRRRATGGDLPAIAELFHKRAFSDMSYEERIFSWSMVDFFISTDQGKFAQLVDRLKGRLKPDGYPDAQGLSDVQRKAIAELYGFSFAELEGAWKSFISKKYASN